MKILSYKQCLLLDCLLTEMICTYPLDEGEKDEILTIIREIKDGVRIFEREFPSVMGVKE